MTTIIKGCLFLTKNAYNFLGDTVFKKLKDYILETEFKIILLDGKVDIVNYLDIDHFDDNKIIVRNNKGTVIIKGEDLIISKLLTDEILILGKIKGLEIRD